MKKREPMTTRYFFCTFLPKLLLVLSLIAYVLGGGILYAVSETAWEASIHIWGIAEIVLCCLIVIWLAVGDVITIRKKWKDSKKQ